jgi:hypothetical protein
MNTYSSYLINNSSESDKVRKNRKDIDNNDYNLSDQIKALQHALALERGENQKFRDEVRALLRNRSGSW